jgi:hypothetical protein
LEPNLEPLSVVHSRPSGSVLTAGPPQFNRILSVGLKSCARTSSIANTKQTNNGTQTKYLFLFLIMTQNKTKTLFCFFFSCLQTLQFDGIEITINLNRPRIVKQRKTLNLIKRSDFYKTQIRKIKWGYVGGYDQIVTRVTKINKIQLEKMTS